MFKERFFIFKKGGPEYSGIGGSDMEGHSVEQKETVGDKMVKKERDRLEKGKGLSEEEVRAKYEMDLKEESTRKKIENAEQNYKTDVVRLWDEMSGRLALTKNEQEKSDLMKEWTARDKYLNKSIADKYARENKELNDYLVNRVRQLKREMIAKNELKDPRKEWETEERENWAKNTAKKLEKLEDKGKKIVAQKENEEGVKDLTDSLDKSLEPLLEDEKIVTGKAHLKGMEMPKDEEIQIKGGYEAKEIAKTPKITPIIDFKEVDGEKGVYKIGDGKSDIIPSGKTFHDKYKADEIVIIDESKSPLPKYAVWDKDSNCYRYDGLNGPKVFLKNGHKYSISINTQNE